MESAALLEPLSVAIHATRRATIEQGDTVIVFGAGTVGLLTAAMAKVSGATTVVIADIDYGRINYALANGFAHKGYIVTPQPSTPDTAENFDQAKELADDIMQIASLNDPEFEGADVTFDCTGKEVCMQAGLYVSLSGSRKVASAHLQTGDKTRRTACHGWHGYSDPNTPHVSFTSQRSRHHWHIPLRQHLPYRHQTHLCRRATKSRQHGDP
jgi:threonine dehydrogenase-like Zn-dependent dehydrogenase